MPMLNNGDTFPTLTVALPDGITATLPGALDGRYGVVLLFRGAWCPYCNAQLRSFQRATEQLSDVNARVFALSSEDESTTTALVQKRRLEFPVGHSADVHEIHDLTGAYIDPDRPNIQSTGFVLAPDGTIVVSVYSSSAIGRLVPEDVIGLIKHHRQHAAQAAA